MFAFAEDVLILR